MLAMVVLAISLMVRPVLATIGEAHELAHDPSGRHTHIVEATGTVEDASEERSTGHALLHFAHCCAQLSVSIADTMFVPVVIPRSVLSVRFDPGLPTAGVRVSPFRPPIRG